MGCEWLRRCAKTIPPRMVQLPPPVKGKQFMEGIHACYTNSVLPEFIDSIMHSTFSALCKRTSKLPSRPT